MKFEKIAELAGDIAVSEERMQDALRNCKRVYRSQPKKGSHMTVFMNDHLKKKDRAR